MNAPLSADPMAWRPCDQTLPPYDERVLMTAQSVNAAYRYVQIGKRTHTSKRGEHWESDDGRAINENFKVTAWIPLPESGYEG